ncbi:MAG: DUF6878 family protein [Rhodobacterales bacterium]
MTQTPDPLTVLLGWQDQTEAQLDAIRADLLADLLLLGVARVEMAYEGYDDSGNVESVCFIPPTEISDALLRRVEDFGWDFAYSFDPGFEIGCGGSGSLDWNLQTDKITVRHCQHDENAEYIEQEGL